MIKTIVEHYFTYDSEEFYITLDELSMFTLYFMSVPCGSYIVQSLEDIENLYTFPIMPHSICARKLKKKKKYKSGLPVDDKLRKSLKEIWLKFFK